jgi:hypothetical protein
MAIELNREARDELVRSIQRYFDENMDNAIGKERLK